MRSGTIDKADAQVAYRTASETVPPSTYNNAPLRIYHSLNPHPALSPYPDPEQVGSSELQARNERVYRQLLVQGALAVLLPTEDLQNACLRTLVSDIIADLILGQGISDKACEGWFLHETCIKIVQMIKSRIEPRVKSNIPTSRSDRSGLSAIKGADVAAHLPDRSQSRILTLFWRLLHGVYLAFVFVRFVIVSLSGARTLPSRLHSSQSIPLSPLVKDTSIPPTPLEPWSTQQDPSPQPILNYRVFTLISTLFGLSSRMPWLTGLLSWCKFNILTGPGRLGVTDSILDK
jgi:hypothetical protein